MRYLRTKKLHPCRNKQHSRMDSQQQDKRCFLYTDYKLGHWPVPCIDIFLNMDRALVIGYLLDRNADQRVDRVHQGNSRSQGRTTHSVYRYIRRDRNGKTPHHRLRGNMQMLSALGHQKADKDKVGRPEMLLAAYPCSIQVYSDRNGHLRCCVDNLFVLNCESISSFP